jgi:hypothetical protein
VQVEKVESRLLKPGDHILAARGLETRCAFSQATGWVHYCVQPHLDVVLLDTVGLEDTARDADAVLEGGGPVELVHAAITDEGRVQGGEVVTGGDDGHAGDLLNRGVAAQVVSLEAKV